jgi:hypothetical protein
MAPNFNDRFYGTRAFAALCLIILATVLLLYTWNETEAGENDPPPNPSPKTTYGPAIPV